MASLSTCHLGLWLGWQILLNLVKSKVAFPVNHRGALPVNNAVVSVFTDLTSQFTSRPCTKCFTNLVVITTLAWNLVYPACLSTLAWNLVYPACLSTLAWNLVYPACLSTLAWNLVYPACLSTLIYSVLWMH